MFVNAWFLLHSNLCFRGSLYDDVLESLSDVRRQAMDNMRKIRERSGTLKGEKYY